MTGSGTSTNKRHKGPKATETTWGGFLANLGLLAAITIFVLAASNWLRPFFNGLPAAMLDRALVVPMLAFLASINSHARGRSEFLRLASGMFLLSVLLLAIMLLVGLAMELLLPPYFQKAYFDELQWFALIALVLLSFPLAPALARIGLMPGFHWHAKRPLRGIGTDDSGRAVAEPGWFPPGAGGRLIAMSAAVGIAFAGYHLVERLALAWPQSLLSLLDPELAALAIFGGGMIGMFYRPASGWTMLLALTLAGSAATTSFLLAFEFALFLLWPDIAPPLSGLISAIALLLMFLFGVFRFVALGNETAGRPTDREQP